MAQIDSFFGLVGDLTWGWSLIPILVVLGVFITMATGFVQFEFFGRMFRVLTRGPEDDTKISAREALLVSIGGRVGGRRGAIGGGGPAAGSGHRSAPVGARADPAARSPA